MKNIIQYINKFNSRLNSRERAILIFGAIGAIVIIAYGAVIGPLTDRYTTLIRMTTQKEEQYRNMLRLKEEYTVLKKEYTELEKGASRTKEGFTPLTFMENVSTQARIRDKVVSMKPRVSSRIIHRYPACLRQRNENECKEGKGKGRPQYQITVCNNLNHLRKRR